MPSLFRLLTKLGITAGIVYAGISALTVMVDPDPREISIEIPVTSFDPQSGFERN